MTYHVGLGGVYFLYCIVKSWLLAFTTILLWSAKSTLFAGPWCGFALSIGFRLPLLLCWCFEPKCDELTVCLFGLFKCLEYGPVFRNQ